MPGGYISALNIKSGVHNLKSASFRPKNLILQNEGQPVLSIDFNCHIFSTLNQAINHKNNQHKMLTERKIWTMI